MHWETIPYPSETSQEPHELPSAQILGNLLGKAPLHMRRRACDRERPSKINNFNQTQDIWEKNQKTPGLFRFAVIKSHMYE